MDPAPGGRALGLVTSMVDEQDQDSAHELEPVDHEVLPDKPRGPLWTPATKDAVARMWVSGAPLSMIASAVGKPAETIRAWVERDTDGKVEEMRGLILRETATHYFEMMSMLPQVRENLRGGLCGADEKTRIELSKWFHERIVPAPVQRTEAEVNHHLPPEFSAALSGIAKSVASLADRPNGGLRIRTGPEALPSPVTELTSGGD